MRRKKPQFNAPPVSGPMPKPASGESQLASVMAPLVDPPNKILNRLKKQYGEDSEDYNKGYRGWYSDMIHGISSRITTVWTKSRRKSMDVDALRKMLNDWDAQSIWLQKSQRQFCGWPLVADCNDSSVKGFLQSKIDPLVAHENWDVFFEHSPYTEFRFINGDLPSLVMGTQHDKVNGTSLVVLADNWNHRNTYCFRFHDPKSLEEFLSGEPYVRSIPFLHAGDTEARFGDNWCYPEISGGLHRKAPLKTSGPAKDHGMVIPFLFEDIVNNLVKEMGARGYDGRPLLDYWEVRKKDVDKPNMHNLADKKYSNRSDSERAKDKATINNLLHKIVPNEEDLDEIISKVVPNDRRYDTETTFGLETQKEIRKALWVALAILKDASKEVIHITQPKEELEGKENDKDDDEDNDKKGKDDYVPPSVRWKTIPLRIKLGPPKEGKKGVGKGVPKSPHHRKGGEVNYSHERYSASGLKGTVGQRGEAKVKGFDGDAPTEALLYSSSPEAKQMAKDILDKDKARANAKKEWLKKEASKKTVKKPVQKPVQEPVQEPVVEEKDFGAHKLVPIRTRQQGNVATAPAVVKKAVVKPVRESERVVETKREVGLVVRLINLVRSMFKK